MTDRDEWGPWIEHDGKGCPCKGMWVEAIDEDGETALGVAPKCCAGGERHWFSPNLPWVPVIRYRIRKPRALRDLIEMVENLPAPAKPVTVGAE